MSEQAQELEKATRDQSQANLWYQHRAGQMTASTLKAAVHTDASQPSHSLIKAICYILKATDLVQKQQTGA